MSCKGTISAPLPKMGRYRILPGVPAPLTSCHPAITDLTTSQRSTPTCPPINPPNEGLLLPYLEPYNPDTSCPFMPCPLSSTPLSLLYRSAHLLTPPHSLLTPSLTPFILCACSIIVWAHLLVLDCFFTLPLPSFPSSILLSVLLLLHPPPSLPGGSCAAS